MVKPIFFKFWGGIILAGALMIVVAYFTMDDPNVIGLQITEQGVISAEFKISYFPLRSEAEKYYKEKNIEKYYLFIKNDEKAEVWFKNLKGYLEPDGSKTVGFLADQTSTTASDKGIEFLKNSKLQKIK